MTQLIKQPWAKGDSSNLNRANTFCTIGDKKIEIKYDNISDAEHSR
jgi:hypothetical protein